METFKPTEQEGQSSKNGFQSNVSEKTLVSMFVYLSLRAAGENKLPVFNKVYKIHNLEIDGKPLDLPIFEKANLRLEDLLLRTKEKASLLIEIPNFPDSAEKREKFLSSMRKNLEEALGENYEVDVRLSFLPTNFGEEGSLGVHITITKKQTSEK